MPNPFLTAALEYRTLGYHVIPCAPREKRPLVPWKDYQTTMPTPEQLTAWWARTPTANVAMVLGRGRFAVDLDGGEAAEQLLAEAGVLLPLEAPRSRTGNGYRVFLSSFNAIPDRVGLLMTHGGKPQVDIRGIGIVVAPPSVHPSGAVYRWLTPLVAELPRAPLALSDLIGKASTRPRAAEEPAAAGDRFWVIDGLHGVTAGQRDQMCTRLAGFFLKKGLSADLATAILCESFARNCDPAFPVRDVEKCVQSIARKYAMSGEADRSIRPIHISAALADLKASMQAGAAPTLPTSFPTLDHYLDGGFAPGELIFLGARPGIGKTALAMEMSRHAARRGAGAVIVISREMKNLALARRVVAQDALVKASTLKRARLTEDEWSEVRHSVARLSRMPLYFTDDAVSFADIVALLETVAAEAPLALVVVDYLQLVRAPEGIKERRHQVEHVSQGLKTLALQYGVPVLCLSSLSRPSGDDKEKPPTLASLRESGELEHDADVILLLHRKYHEQATTCYVAKNRDGRLGDVALVFRHEYVSFKEAEVAP